jgi:2-C-methyl-D-erythritol 4-phosphate cytidylyltransferase
MKVQLVEGEEDNIKITRPIDLLIAEKLMDERNA